jgi:DNA polymerase III subunit beta
MKITTSREALASALGLAARAAAPGSGEALSRLRIDVVLADDGTATLVATGGDAARCVQTRLPVQADTAGVVQVPAQLTAGLLKDLTGERVVLEIGDTELNLTHDSGSYKIPVYTDDGFRYPQASSDNPVTVPGSLLSEVVARIAPAASKDQNRGALTAVKLEASEETLSVVATDSYRLAVSTVSISTIAEPLDLKVPAVALEAGVKLLSKCATVKIHADDRTVTFDGGDIQISVRQSEGNYPSWPTLVKDEPPLAASMSSAAISAKIRRVAKFAGVLDFVFAPEGSLTISGAGIGSAVEVCDCEFSGTEELRIRFNPAYVLDAVAATPGEMITVKIKDPTSPVWVRGSTEQTIVVMPNR